MANVVAGGAAGGATGVADNDKYLSAVGYVIICCALPLFLVPMLAAKESRFAQFHARQGAALYIVAIGASIVMFIVNLVLEIAGNAIGFPYLICLGQVVSLLLFAVWFVLMIIGVINSLQAQEKPLPGVGGLAAKLPF